MTNQDIENLIKVTKKISKREPNEGYKDENNNRNCRLNLSDDQNMQFQVFIRQNKTFTENFSIGLIYKDLEMKENISLIRYNSSHHQHRKSNESHRSDQSVNNQNEDHHLCPHIHRITEEDIKNGNFNRPKKIELTDKYITFEKALQSFLEDLNIENWKDYFPELDQGELFNGY